jgi:hypothetical protein
MKPVILDFVGSHSTGKTTCIQHAKSVLSRLSFTINEVPSTSRTQVNNMIEKAKLYDGVDDFTQAWISMTNWSNILSSAMMYDFTLCTDLGVRSLAYTLSSQHTKSVTELAHKNMVDFFNSDLFLAGIDVYRIYLPIEFEIEPDGVRTLDKEFQQKMDENLHYIFRTCNIPVITLSGDKQSRNQQINDLITRITFKRCTWQYKPGSGAPETFECFQERGTCDK